MVVSNDPEVVDSSPSTVATDSVLSEKMPVTVDTSTELEPENLSSEVVFTSTTESEDVDVNVVHTVLVSKDSETPMVGKVELVSTYVDVLSSIAGIFVVSVRNSLEVPSLIAEDV